MTTSITNSPSFVIQLREHIEYPQMGVFSKVLMKDSACQYTMFCLAANTEISQHTSPRNATVNVFEGKGLFTLAGEDIQLERGVFIFLPANTPHALKAESNLTFLLTLSEKVADGN